MLSPQKLYQYVIFVERQSNMSIHAGSVDTNQYKFSHNTLNINFPSITSRIRVDFTHFINFYTPRMGIILQEVIVLRYAGDNDDDGTRKIHYDLESITSIGGTLTYVRLAVSLLPSLITKSQPY